MKSNINGQSVPADVLLGVGLEPMKVSENRMLFCIARLCLYSNSRNTVFSMAAKFSGLTAK